MKYECTSQRFQGISVSFNGNFFLSPYTELEDAKINFFTLFLFEILIIFIKPIKLLLKYEFGIFKESLTPA